MQKYFKKSSHNICRYKKNTYLCIALEKKVLLNGSFGEVAEWSIAAVLKTVVLRGTGGSNPSLSAINAENQQNAKQTPSFTPKIVKLGVFVLFKISYLREWANSKSANNSSCFNQHKIPLTIPHMIHTMLIGHILNDHLGVQ